MQYDGITSQTRTHPSHYHVECIDRVKPIIPMPPMTSSPAITTKSATHDIQHVISQGLCQYFIHCQHRVPGFVDKHYRYPGAWRTNRLALGWDLLRLPINLFWAPIYVLLQLIRYGFRKAGWETATSIVDRVPSGFTTTVQKNIHKLIYNELLGCPFDKENSDLYQHIETAIKQHLNKTHSADIDQTSLVKSLRPALQEAMAQYAITRTASADITNSLMGVITGALWFNKFTPGGLGLGLILAAAYSKSVATHNFIFGETLGHYYYTIFPPSPSITVTIMSTVVVLIIFSLLAALSGTITDPLQAVLRIHQRRLRKMLSALERDIERHSQQSFRPKDQYVARILDMVDAMKTHVAGLA